MIIEYHKAGLSVLPIQPGHKRPGMYQGGVWRPMKGWQQYCTHLAPRNVVERWEQWPDTGVGLALGPASNLLAIDIDVNENSTIFKAIRKVCPDTPCAKVGKKGITLFYRYNPIITSTQIRLNGNPTVDILSLGKQTVLPPTIHPDMGEPYRWIGDPINTRYNDIPDSPPNITDLIKGQLIPYQISPQEVQYQPAAGDEEWRHINENALLELDRWVPYLVPSYKPYGDGYRAIATWRGGDDWNVGINPNGIVDFARGIGYTPINLVMAIKGGNASEARAWLEEKLSIVDDRLIQGQRIVNGLISANEAKKTEGSQVIEIAEAKEMPPPSHPWNCQAVFEDVMMEWRDPIPYVVDGMIPSSRMGVLSGEPGTYKTMILIDMMIAIANGQDWMGLKTQKARALWLNADSPTDVILDRFAALMRGRNVTPTIGNIHVLSYPQPALDLSDAKKRQLLASYIVEHDIGFMAVDALQRVKGGADENDNNKMGEVMDGARAIVEKTGVSLVFIHHNTKAQDGKASHYRGASAIKDALDYALLATREDQSIKIAASKAREAEIEPVRANFAFTHYENTKKLCFAWMLKEVQVDFIKPIEGPSLEQDIMNYIFSRANDIHPCCMSDIYRDVTGKQAKIRDHVNELVASGKVDEHIGQRNKKYFKPSLSHNPSLSQPIPGVGIDQQPSLSREPIPTYSPLKGGSKGFGIGSTEISGSSGNVGDLEKDRLDLLNAPKCHDEEERLPYNDD